MNIIIISDSTDVHCGDRLLILGRLCPVRGGGRWKQVPLNKVDNDDANDDDDDYADADDDIDDDAHDNDKCEEEGAGNKFLSTRLMKIMIMAMMLITALITC